MEETTMAPDLLAPEAGEASTVDAACAPEAPTPEAVRYFLSREPQKRELYYAALRTVAEADGPFALHRPDLTGAMAACPQAASMHQSLGTLVDALVTQGLLEAREPEPVYDEAADEEIVDRARTTYALTEAGRAATDDFAPASRLAALLAEEAEHGEQFRKLLAFCSEAPRTRQDIDGLLNDYCAAIPTKFSVAAQGLYPSYFTDRLEKCGALVWQNGWRTTEAGRSLLAAR